jgi:flagellar biosynthesis activator protein FlaF
MEKSPIDASTSVNEENLTGRALEAHVLMKAIAALQECQNQWDEPGQEERLDAALRYNMKLWTLFQEELMNESNALPLPLKQDLFNLSVFIDKQTFNIMAKAHPDKANLDALININRNIAEGLNGAGH